MLLATTENNLSRNCHKFGVDFVTTSEIFVVTPAQYKLVVFGN